MIYPIQQIRNDFPILSQSINKYPLVYLDNAASSQKPNVVINAQNDFYKTKYANAHRGIYALSKQSTFLMEKTRANIATFLNASDTEEIIFTKSTTEGINLVANSWGQTNTKSGDNVIITQMEHHSNIVPWQVLSKKNKLTLKFIPLKEDGKLDITKLKNIIDKNTKLIAITQLSNVIGTLNPLHNIISQIKNMGDIKILVDGAQGIVHHTTNVQKMDCDFYVFSGHKIYGPSGIGVLYGKKKLLQNMPPYEYGGGMIQKVSLVEDTVFMDSPWRFEAGSPNIGGIIGLNAAIEYIKKIKINVIQNYEKKLMQYAIRNLLKIPDIILYGTSDRVAVIAFNINKYHSYDVGSLLDQYGIAIRTGHHCAIPLMNYFRVHSMCRASLSMYTNYDDIDKLIDGLTRIRKILQYTK